MCRGIEAIEPGRVVHTDGWDGYTGVERRGDRHEITVRTRSASELMPRVHRVVVLSKRWLHGTHQGAGSHAHLHDSLGEFTVRFNRRTSRSRGKLFYRLVQQSVAVEPAPYTAMVQHARGRKPGNHKI